MKNKIELFQELVASDPTSKVFYPLARLYAESGMLLQAADTLRQGLSRHPDHMEARLLLIDILSQTEHREEALEEVRTMSQTLARYPSFWGLWAEREGDEDPDMAVALNFLNAYLAGQGFSWVDILQQGFEALAKKKAAQGTFDEGLDLMDQEEVEEGEVVAAPGSESAASQPETGEFIFEEGEVERAAAAASKSEDSLATRTMAELRVAQGDYDGALEILRTLRDREASVDERRSLERRMAEVDSMRGQAPAASPAQEGDETDFLSAGPMRRAKEKLVNSLSTLADRLEARAGV
ncbi:tetratricopeptide repeat protein [Desulfohalovibrio reitneri]|uniref:tetratricopeptide repeat protein n=1 Tax=Desulfohalovibrio reitneri TaxID=1307759 RepID=UPI0004A7756A|nr:tetratricopeptide repeat protein [Desulfohalovibrio reitneri]